MYQAEQVHLLTDKQFGSCKFKSAIYQCLKKQLFYDLIHFSRQLEALCSNNAKSCYDHIVLLVAALCLCCWVLGATSPTMFSMINTIYGMNHHIQTLVTPSIVQIAGYGVNQMWA